MTHLLLSPAQPIGKVEDYFYRVEFQARGSPHIHLLVWVKDAPEFENDSDKVVCDFIDRYITCQLPNPTGDPFIKLSQRSSFTAGITPSHVRKDMHYEDLGSLNYQSLTPRSFVHDHSVLKKRITWALLHQQAACLHLKPRSLAQDHSILK